MKTWIFICVGMLYNTWEISIYGCGIRSMSFFSIHFCVFFLLTFFTYYLLPAKFRQSVLLIASLFFYACFDLKFVMVLILVISVSYFVAIRTDKCNENNNTEGAKRCFIFGVGLVIALLVYFKFWNYMILAIDKIFGSQVDGASAASILAPVGISFFSLEAIGYMTDVYRGTVRAEKSLCKYALFLSFFPKIMSGPIERSTNLLQQLRTEVAFEYNSIRKGFLMILWGSFIKLLIANRLSMIVDALFGNYHEQTGMSMVIATLLYGVQLYVDFSGYSYIASGLSGVFGYNILINFKQPYFAKDIRDFWRRWHISLSNWLRDYVYIPLGGSRNGTARRFLAIMATFSISGLWHGTGMHFLLWGILHGLYQVASIMKDSMVKNNSCTTSFSRRLLKALLTFLLADFAWLIFRAPSVGAVLEIIHKVVFLPEIGRTIVEGLWTGGVDVSKYRLVVFESIALLGIDICHERRIDVSGWLGRQEKWFRWMVYILLTFLILIGLIRDYGAEASAFIYTQF